MRGMISPATRLVTMWLCAVLNADTRSLQLLVRTSVDRPPASQRVAGNAAQNTGSIFRTPTASGCTVFRRASLRCKGPVHARFWREWAERASRGPQHARFSRGGVGVGARDLVLFSKSLRYL